MDKLKYVKLENPDGSYSNSIPLSVSSEYVDLNSSGTLNLSSYVETNNANVRELQIQVGQNTSAISGLASGSPKGVYATTAALISANPATGVYVVTADGHLYSWTKGGSSAIDLGVYQAALSELHSLDNSDIGKNVLSFDSLDKIVTNDINVGYDDFIDLENDEAVTKTNNKYWRYSDSTKKYAQKYDSGNLGYCCYEMDVLKGEVYHFIGKCIYQVQGVMLIDPNDNNKIYYMLNHDNATATEFFNVTFRVPKDGLKLAITGKNDWLDIAAPHIRKVITWKGEDNYKENFPTVIETYTGRMAQLNGGTSGNYVTMHTYAAATTTLYELKKGCTYHFMGYNYGYGLAFIVIDKNLQKVLTSTSTGAYLQGWFKGTPIIYTPEEDCFLLHCTFAEGEVHDRNSIKMDFYEPNETATGFENALLNSCKNLIIEEYEDVDLSNVETLTNAYYTMDYQTDLNWFLRKPSSQINNYGDYIVPVEEGEIYAFETQHSYAGTAWGTLDKDRVLLRAVELPSSQVQKMVKDILYINPGEKYLVISSRNFQYLRKVKKFTMLREPAPSVLKGLKICYDGDSLTESRLNTSSVAYNGGAYAKLIADKVDGTYENQAVGGGTITSQEAVGGTRHSVYDNLENLPTDADIYVFSGGINDYWQSQNLGEVTTGYTDTIDPGTICGALEGIFRYAIDNFLGKPILFVITHKVSQTHLNPNSKGYTFQDVVDKIIAICKKYSIPYYNAFDESGVNGGISSQNLEFMTAGSSGSSDGCHINEKGYGKYYVPQIIAKLESMVNLDYLDE